MSLAVIFVSAGLTCRVLSSPLDLSHKRSVIYKTGI